MILAASFSKPAGICKNILGEDYKRIRIKPVSKNSTVSYFAELFTDTQSFHKSFSEKELLSFIQEHAGKTFLQCVYRTETEEITILGNKKGSITTLKKKLIHENHAEKNTPSQKTYPMQNLLQSPRSENRNKVYILPEGTPIPFLVFLGIMAPSGKVISAKYAKFRQINRFLEFFDDILDDVISLIKSENNNSMRPIQIADFGCGKSYLTFAVYYYVTQIKKLPVHIIGLDLKEDVISYCNTLAKQFNYENLHFSIGNIADFNYQANPDIVMTLHACDTATDYALTYAVSHEAKAILSVPCCQHEINQQLDKEKSEVSESVFSSILKYGLLKERFSAIVTDALRADFLEQQNYKVQILEFIDMEHTPKNLLIRAVKKNKADLKTVENAEKRSSALIHGLNIHPSIFLKDK